MRILVMDGQRTVGGGQVMTRHILRVLAAAGHEVAAAVPDGRSDLAALLEGYRVFGFPLAEFTRGRKSLGDVWRFAAGFWAARTTLVRIICEWRPDLVYVQNSIPVPYAVAAASAAGAHAKGSHAGGVPVVAHLHIRHSDPWSRALLSLFLSRPCVRAIVAPSAYTLGQLPPRLGAKFRVVHNFVAPQDAAPRRLPARVPVVAMMGDVCEAKGQHILLEAAAAVVAAGVPLAVRIAGPIVDEEYAARIGATDSARVAAAEHHSPPDASDKRAAEHPISRAFGGRVADAVRMDTAAYPFPVTFEGRVTDDTRMETAAYPFPVEFEGRVADGARWVAGADLVVCPSRSETFCLSMVEAWAQGVPTLASRGSGMQELIEKFMPDMADTMLFDRENRAELAEKITRLLTDPALYTAVSRRALAVARALSETEFAKGISEVVNHTTTTSRLNKNYMEIN